MKAYDYLDFHAQHQPDAEFAVCSGQRMTYRQARQTANRIAHAIVAAGLQRGDRVAVLLRNRLETVCLYLGAFKAGIVATPINPRLQPSEWREICIDAEAKLVVCDSCLADQVDAFREQLSTVRQFITVAGAKTGWHEFDSWISHHPGDAAKSFVREEDDALQMYTSGTTGKPRGVVLTHRAITSCLAQLGLVVQFRPTDCFLLIMPLFHAAGMIAMLQVISGGASLLIQSGFEPTDVMEALSTEGVSVTMLAPTMIQACLSDASSLLDREFKDLRLIIYGASPINEDTLREAMQVFGCDFAQRYGSTETLCLTWLSAADHRLALAQRPELLRSAGRPLPGLQFRVVDSGGQEVPAGSEGEFVVNGPGLMRGYWKQDDESNLDADGQRWIHTGDSGFQDSDGYIYICDRVNDVIISGGENIHPREIEDVLLEHPDVCEAAVIGVPDDKWGEAVKAIVVPRRGADLTAEQLIVHCRERLAGFKTPHSVETVPALPRNSSGKVLRFKLREPHWQHHHRRI